MDDLSPYNIYELARARDIFSNEINKDPYRFLRRRINGFIKTTSQLPKNLWEGPEGNMEHVNLAFPMPSKVETEDNKAATAADVHSSENSETEITPNMKDQQKEGTASQVQFSEGEIEDDSSLDEENEEDMLTQHTLCNISPSISNERRQYGLNNNVTSTDFSSNSQGIQKVCHDNSTDFPSASKTERNHWIQLSNIQKKIEFACNDLKTSKFLFKKSKLQKACKEMETLYWNIHGLITSLTEEKKCRDKNNFRLIQTKKPTRKTGQYSEKLSPQSYHKTWKDLERLCTKFKQVWRANKTVILKLSAMEDVPQAKLKNRLHKISVKHL